MGWLSDVLDYDAAHEGWVAGTSATSVELFGGTVDRDGLSVELDSSTEPCPIRWVRAACECGWRSGWTEVPDAEWVRYSVLVPEVITDAIALAWSEHIKNVVAWRRVEQWDELPALLGLSPTTARGAA